MRMWEFYIYKRSAILRCSVIVMTNHKSFHCFIFIITHLSLSVYSFGVILSNADSWKSLLFSKSACESIWELGKMEPASCPLWKHHHPRQGQPARLGLSVVTSSMPLTDAGRECRFKEGICTYCASPAHHRAICPLRMGNVQAWWDGKSAHQAPLNS